MSVSKVRTRKCGYLKRSSPDKGSFGGVAMERNQRFLNRVSYSGEAMHPSFSAEGKRRTLVNHGVTARTCEKGWVRGVEDVGEMLTDCDTPDLALCTN